MHATLRIDRLLTVRGRGPVVAGEVLAGIVRAGMWIVPTDAPALRIDAVEAIDAPDLPPGEIALVLNDAHAADAVRRRLPPGITVSVAAPLEATDALATGPACHRGLRRYWFPLTTARGIGVTAATDAEAAALAIDAQRRTAPTATLLEPLVDVDVSALDPDHVLPNIGPVVVRGVWFPRENL